MLTGGKNTVIKASFQSQCYSWKREVAPTQCCQVMWRVGGVNWVYKLSFSLLPQNIKEKAAWCYLHENKQGGFKQRVCSTHMGRVKGFGVCVDAQSNSLSHLSIYRILYFEGQLLDHSFWSKVCLSTWPIHIHKAHNTTTRQFA